MNAVLAAILLTGAAAGTPAERAYEQAVAARHAGNPALAVQLLEPLVASEPANSDAWVQLGYAQLALGRLADAERSFGKALALAPSYQDARDGLALAKRRRPPRFRLDADGAYSWVGRGQRDWREGSVQLRFAPDARIAVTGRAEAARRFGRSDLYLEARADWSGGRGNAYLLAGGAPDADFRPRNQLGAGGGVKLVEGASPTIATLDARRARYPSGTVWTLNPGIEQYLWNGRAWVTLRWINTIEGGRSAAGWLARGDVQATRRVRLFMGTANAPDTSEGLVIDTASIFGGAAIDLDDRRSVRLSLARDKPEGGAPRTQLAIGAGLRF